jgi:DNA-binding transcriptional regulator YiaG
MMNKVLFHGSPKIVEKPLLGFGKNSNDFGPGFYCTEDRELAKEWAVSYKSNGYLNKYEIDIEGLNVLDLKSVDDGFNQWIALILDNRPTSISSELKGSFINSHYPDLYGVDVILGYRGDSSIFTILDDYLNNKIDTKNLLKKIKKSGLGDEIVLVSQTAIDKLKFIGCESVSYFDCYRTKQIRDQKEREIYYKNNSEETARKNLALFLDYGVNVLNVSLDGLWSRFLMDDRSIQFGNGDYSVTSGISGIELAYLITGFTYDHNYIYQQDETAEYWLGSYLAYAQQKLKVSFQMINKYVPISELLSLYYPFHLMSEDKFVEFLKTAIKVRKGKTNLEIYRREAKLSRSELSEKSGVPLRMIEHYEQRVKNINKANAEYLLSLAKALFVSPESLLEIE